MFEEAQLYSPVTTGDGGEVTVHLHDGHPGADDPGYRRRRNEIAAAALALAPRRARAARSTTTTTSRTVWRTVCRELAPLHERLRRRRVPRGARAASRCRPTASPASTRSARGSARCGGWRYVPAAGLVDLRTFYGALADRTLSLHAVRPPPGAAALHARAGHRPRGHRPRPPARDADVRRAAPPRRRRRARGCATSESLRFLSRVFWFTLEFGVVVEDGELRAYGAGILSSYGELGEFRAMELRPLDLRRDGHRRLRHHAATSRSCTAPSPSPRSRPSSAASSTPAPTNRSRSCAVSTLSLDPARRAASARDFMPLHGIDHIELWVGNAAQAAYVLHATRSASPRSPTRASRPGCATASRTCCSRAASGSC